MAMNSFWASPDVEPKRAFRFLLHINGIPSWMCKKVTKPNFTIESSKHQYLNHEFNFPSGVKWDKCSATLVDPVNPDASKTVMNIINASGYHFPENPNDVSTISKAAAIAALGMVKIEQIGAYGETVEEWELVNAWVSAVKFGALDYNSTDMTEIELEFTYDYAKMTRSGNAVPL